MSRPVVVTRAEPGLAGTLARLDAGGYTAVAAPTAQIAALAVDPPGDVAALAVTSRNGAERAAALFQDRSLPIYAVGDASADAVRTHGFTQVASAEGDGPALANLIDSAKPAGQVIHVRGRDQAFDLVAELKARGLSAVGLVAYAAQPAQSLPAAATAALRGGARILVHSAKGAERFLALARDAGLLSLMSKQYLAAISGQAAAPCLDAGFARIDIAARPNEDSLMSTLRAFPD